MAKKKKMKHKGDTFEMAEVSRPKTRVSVDIKKANNGFVVSTWGDSGEKVYIAKTKKEADKYANKLLIM